MLPDEQNSQSSMENSMNSSEQVASQPSGDAGLAAETSTISQVLDRRSQRAASSARSLLGCRGTLKGVFLFLFSQVCSLDDWNCLVFTEQDP